jgi:hypothetical protein
MTCLNPDLYVLLIPISPQQYKPQQQHWHRLRHQHAITRSKGCHPMLWIRHWCSFGRVSPGGTLTAATPTSTKLPKPRSCPRSIRSNLPSWWSRRCRHRLITPTDPTTGAATATSRSQRTHVPSKSTATTRSSSSWYRSRNPCYIRCPDYQRDKEELRHLQHKANLLAIWYAVQYPGVINPNLMATLVVAAEEDSNRLTERDRQAVQARTSVNKAIHFALRGIRANNPATHPIDL